MRLRFRPGWRFFVVCGLVVCFSIGALNLVSQFIIQRNNDAARERTAVAVEAKICTTFRKLAALQPPPGNPDNNPSRKYLQDQHVVLSGVVPDLGCKVILPNVASSASNLKR